MDVAEFPTQLALTGDQDSDLEILFALPDRELLRLCGTNTYLQSLCSSSQAESFWERRYLLRFPEPAERVDTWRNTYLSLARSKQIDPTTEESIATILRDEYNHPFPCLAGYFTSLSRQLYYYMDNVEGGDTVDGVETILKVLGESRYGQHILDNLESTHVPPYDADTIVREAIMYVLHRGAKTSPGKFLLPWWINKIILQDSSLTRIFPRVDELVTITIVIGNRQDGGGELSTINGPENVSQETRGEHNLSEEQFMGMAVYVNYVTYTKVDFLLSGCLLNLTAQEISRRIPHGEKASQYITMLNGDRFIFTTPEFMQGFMAMAGWLGEDYRRGYLDVGNLKVWW